MKVQMGRCTVFNLGARCRWKINATPRPLYPRERDPVPITQEAGWAPGPVRTAPPPRPDRTWGRISPPPGIRFPDRPARSESLYRMRYPGTRHMHARARTHTYTHTYVPLLLWKAVSIAWSECESVALVIQYAKRKPHSVCGLCGSTIFFHIIP